jgi:hypothetical protein
MKIPLNPPLENKGDLEGFQNAPFILKAID